MGAYAALARATRSSGDSFAALEPFEGALRVAARVTYHTNAHAHTIMSSHLTVMRRLIER